MVDVHLRSFNPVDINNQDHLEVLLFYFEESFTFIQKLADFYKAEAEKFAQISDKSDSDTVISNNSETELSKDPHLTELPFFGVDDPELHELLEIKNKANDN